MPSVRKKPLPEINPTEEPIGKRLAKIRKAKGLTQVQIADLIGISQYLVSDYERGRLHLSDEMIIRFSRALQTSSDTILGLDKTDMEQFSQSLRLVKRLKKIEQLPSPKQKALLQTIDGFLKGESYLEKE